MSVINDLINIESDSLDFGNYELATKTKKDGIEYKGDIYKIKTFNEITKLEKNGMFVYESVPGTTFIRRRCIIYSRRNRDLIYYTGAGTGNRLQDSY